MPEVTDVDIEEIDKNIKAELEKTSPKPDEQEYTESELEALDHGWKPDGKDKDGNTLSADEYLARAPLFNKINKLNHKIEDMTRTVKGLQEHNRLSADKAIKERDELLKQLKDAKEKAYEDLDVDEARKIDQQIEALHDEPAVVTEKYTEKDFTDAYDKFVKEHTWYLDNPGLQAAATNIGQVFMHNDPSASPDELYEHVISETKKMFPDHFAEKKRATSVGTTKTRTKPSAGRQKHTLSDIPEQHQEMARVIIASGVSEEEYCKQYFLEE